MGLSYSHQDEISLVKPSARTNSFAALYLLALAIVTVVPVKAVERITFKDKDGKSHSMVGQSQVTAADGGRLFLADDGQLWTIQKDAVESFEETIRRSYRSQPTKFRSGCWMNCPMGLSYTAQLTTSSFTTPTKLCEMGGGLFEQLHKGFMPTEEPGLAIA